MADAAEADSRALLPEIVAGVQSHCGELLQRVVLFGSRAGGFVRAGSDVDLLVLVEPPPRSWRAADNVLLRQRLQRAFSPIAAPVDVWVRTTDQFCVSRYVIGCVEHWAAKSGHTLFERPARRVPESMLTREQVRDDHVRDWMRDARGQLGRAVLGASGRIGRSDAGRVARPPQHYAVRAIQRGIGALFVRHQIEPPRKLDSPATWARHLAAMEPDVSARCRALLDGRLVTLETARAAILATADRLAEERRYAPFMRGLIDDITRPLDEPAWGDAPAGPR